MIDNKTYLEEFFFSSFILEYLLLLLHSKIKCYVVTSLRILLTTFLFFFFLFYRFFHFFTRQISTIKLEGQSTVENKIQREKEERSKELYREGDYVKLECRTFWNWHYTQSANKIKLPDKSLDVKKEIKKEKKEVT